MTIEQAIAKAIAWAQWAVSIGVLILFAVTLISMFGVDIPVIGAPSPINMLYVAGAYALTTGRLKLG